MHLKTHIAAICFLVMDFSGYAFAKESLVWCHPSRTESEITWNANNALGKKDLAQLRDMFLNMNSPSCVFDDGIPKLSKVRLGISNGFKQRDWVKNLELVEALKTTAAGEPMTALIEAQYWIDYAWNARGNGYASSVAADGWKLFGERIKMAEKVLTDSKSYAASNPIWYQQMIIVKSVSGALPRERDAIFVEGISLFTWYVTIYQNMLEYISPWWGGSWDGVDNMIAWSVEKTKAEMGTSMYARLYQQIGETNNVRELFKETKASWPKMKKGFDDLLHRYPKNNRIWNAYTHFACEADDRTTYLKLRKQIATSGIDEMAWAGGKRREVCDAKFGFGS